MRGKWYSRNKKIVVWNIRFILIFLLLLLALIGTNEGIKENSVRIKSSFLKLNKLAN